MEVRVCLPAMFEYDYGLTYKELALECRLGIELYRTTRLRGGSDYPSRYGSLSSLACVRTHSWKEFLNCIFRARIVKSRLNCVPQPPPPLPLPLTLSHQQPTTVSNAMRFQSNADAVTSRVSVDYAFARCSDNGDYLQSGTGVSKQRQ